jgi:hypothetical protein
MVRKNILEIKRYQAYQVIFRLHMGRKFLDRVGVQFLVILDDDVVQPELWHIMNLKMHI